MRYYFLILFTSLSVFLVSCAFAPVNNQYEKARTLKKGNVELAGSFSGYSITGGGGSENTNTNFGFRAGYGITDKFDLKIRYERLLPDDGYGSKDIFDEGNITGVNYYSIVPKFSLIADKLSLLIPLSHYSFKKELDGKKTNGTLNSIAPQIIYTITGEKNKSDFSFGLKADGFFGDGGGGGVLLGITMGTGFSSDLTRWAIRPEVGASFIGGGAFLSYGVGLQLLLHNKKSQSLNK